LFNQLYQIKVLFAVIDIIEFSFTASCVSQFQV